MRLATAQTAAGAAGQTATDAVTLDGLSPKTTYTIRIRAVDAANDTSPGVTTVVTTTT